MNDETVPTVDDTSEVTETVETNQGVPEDAHVETEELDLSSVSIDDLLDMQYNSEEEKEIFSREHTGLPPAQEILRHATPDVKKLVSNLRADYSRKTQELAETRRHLAEEKARLDRERQSLYDGRFAKHVEELASRDMTDVDPWTEEGIQARIQQEAARLFKQMMEPIQQDMRIKEREAAMNNFVSEHPEIKTEAYRLPMAKLLRDRPELSLEDAYWIVNGRIKAEESARIQAEREADRRARSQALRKTSTGKNVTGRDGPKFKSAIDAYNYLKSQGMK